MSNTYLGKTARRQVLLSFNVSEAQRHSAGFQRFKNLLWQHGFQDFVVGTNSKGEARHVPLPSNIFWKANTSPKEAKATLREAAKYFGIEIENAFAAEIVEWSGSSGKPLPAGPGQTPQK